MKNLLKVGEIVVNLDQLTHTIWKDNYLYLFFTDDKRHVRFDGEDAAAVWAELERRSDAASAEPPEAKVHPSAL